MSLWTSEPAHWGDPLGDIDPKALQALLDLLDLDPDKLRPTPEGLAKLEVQLKPFRTRITAEDLFFILD